MNLGEFHEQIAQELRRGRSLDLVIPNKVRDAVQFLERNHAMKYMETVVTIDLVTGDQLVDLPFSVRNIKFLRIEKFQGEQLSPTQYLRNRAVQEDQHDVDSESVFASFALIGAEAIRFNVAAPGPMRLFGIIYKLTDWQTTDKTFEHYLLRHASDLLMAQSMMNMAVFMRDQRMIAAYRVMRDEALRTFFVMDTDVTEGGQNEQMEYRSIYG